MIDELIALLQTNPALGLVISFLLIAVLACIPFMPTPLVIVGLATQFDWYIAALISIGGSVFGSLMMYSVSKYWFTSWAQMYIEKRPKLYASSKLIAQHGFTAVLTARVVPIMPSAAVNVIAAIVHVPFIAFFMATAIGKMPNTIVYALAGSGLEEHFSTTLVAVMIYVVCVGGIARAVKQQLGRKRAVEQQNSREKA